ncbi:hypothetical protein D039_4908A, partial [Vibrio parahaemolyticus EKP-028]
MIARGIRTPS